MEHLTKIDNKDIDAKEYFTFDAEGLKFWYQIRQAVQTFDNTRHSAMKAITSYILCIIIIFIVVLIYERLNGNLDNIFGFGDFVTRIIVDIGFLIAYIFFIGFVGAALVDYQEKHRTLLLIEAFNLRIKSNENIANIEYNYSTIRNLVDIMIQSDKIPSILGVSLTYDTLKAAASLMLSFASLIVVDILSFNVNSFFGV